MFMSVLFIEKFVYSWEVGLEDFLKIYSRPMGNSCCKKDYSKGEVNVVKIRQIRL